MKRILIAEDDPAVLAILAEVATRRGYYVSSVTNGYDLLNEKSDGTFDLVITDLVMPELNGPTATEIMRLQGSTTPVIALTGLAPEDIVHVKDKFTKVYHKPVSTSELFEYVKTLLQ